MSVMYVFPEHRRIECWVVNGYIVRAYLDIWDDLRRNWRRGPDTWVAS